LSAVGIHDASSGDLKPVDGSTGGDEDTGPTQAEMEAMCDEHWDDGDWEGKLMIVRAATVANGADSARKKLDVIKGELERWCRGQPAVPEKAYSALKKCVVLLCVRVGDGDGRMAPAEWERHAADFVAACFAMKTDNLAALGMEGH